MFRIGVLLALFLGAGSGFQMVWDRTGPSSDPWETRTASAAFDGQGP